MKILHVKSSIFGDNGKSNELARHFLEQWKTAHPDTQVIERDLNEHAIPHLDLETFQANLTPKNERTAAQQEKSQLADTLIDELIHADVLLLSVPMYNFGIPSTLKAWIDNVARAGTTFKYTANGPVGLVNNTKAYVLGARGGAYAGTPNDTQTPYLKTLLGFLGINEVECVFAEKLNMEADRAQDIIADAKNAIDALVKP